MVVTDWLYRRRIRIGLGRAYKRAEEETLELSSIRAVIFSDHHRGKQDGADDFRRCEAAYRTALGHYLERGWSLWLLGDVEELWENDPRGVLCEYGEVLKLERAFGPDRLWRFWGNHDMAWRREKLVERELRAHLPRQTKVREGVRLRLVCGGNPVGTIFLTHGHQGTIDSGNALVVPLSRFVVRQFWGRLQRAQGFASTAPSQRSDLRFKHDQAMFEWASSHYAKSGEKVVLIAGHTHHPVVPGDPPPDLRAEEEQAAAALDAARLAQPPDPAAVVAARARHELTRTRAERSDNYVPPEIDPPCYFNSGCCSYGDGDVTGLEISDRRIQLVRWLDDQGDPASRELSPSLDLKELFTDF